MSAGKPRGLPRAVNNLAIQALVAAFATNKTIVDESSARAAVTEVRSTDHHNDTLTTSPAGHTLAGLTYARKPSSPNPSQTWSSSLARGECPFSRTTTTAGCFRPPGRVVPRHSGTTWTLR